MPNMGFLINSTFSTNLTPVRIFASMEDCVSSQLLLLMEYFAAGFADILIAFVMFSEMSSHVFLRRERLSTIRISAIDGMLQRFRGVLSIVVPSEMGDVGEGTGTSGK